MQMKNNIAHATKVITAHVPLPMADKIDLMVTRLERSRVWIIRQALSDFVRLYDFLVLSSKPAAASDTSADHSVNSSTYGGTVISV
ncbi:CopG family transcriptional regulator [Escherichia coli]|nr:hypothetical protein ECDEC5B_5621 [Escherichia coli DEC5B]EHW3014079.1 CopG family transcriptional regulator [Escherichia coli]EHW5237501.1 CopG family transcriptional regulator [Escherichia coli]EHW6033794.1 CopG family transcriptional regulator [Escherichia coli]EHX0877780.1 CopG family transcriptional regulator [Escherichia coli]